MSVYKQIIEAVELAIFVHQYKTKEEITWFVEYWTDMKNINVNEIEKIIHRVTTSYKKVA